MNDKLIITNFLTRKYTEKSELVDFYRNRGDNGKLVSRALMEIDVRKTLGYSTTIDLGGVINDFLLNM